MAAMIRILVADSHALLREGLQHILDEVPAIAVMAEAADGFEAIARARDGGVDVLVVELSLPGRSGIEPIRQLKREAPSIPILVLTLHDVETHAAAFRAGARGFLNKSTSSEQQIAARMDISVKTVSTYKARLMEKMGMSTVSQLVPYGIEHRLLDA